MNNEILTSIFFILLGLFGFHSSYKIKIVDIEKEELSGESKKHGYIPLRARKNKSLVGGYIFIIVGIFFLFNAILS